MSQNSDGPTAKGTHSCVTAQLLCAAACTFQVGDFHLFDLLHLLVLLLVFAEEPAVVLALHLVLLLQVIELLLQVLVLVLRERRRLLPSRDHT